MSLVSRFGELPPQHTFALNTYPDVRFTHCPGCHRTTGQRKLPLIVHMEPRYLNVFVHTCRYCPACDLLIAHHDLLALRIYDWFEQYDPSVLKNWYLVIGVLERRAWNEYLRAQKYIDEVMAGVHDFAAVMRIERAGADWQLIDITPDFLAEKQSLIDRAVYTLRHVDTETAE